MIEVRLQMPDGAFSALKKGPEAFGLELRLAAAVKWYERQMISQGRAAEIAGVSRAEFIEALSRYGVSPFQYDADEVLSEVLDG